MIFKKLHITIVSIFVWSFSFAQQYTNYTTKEGLPSNHVYKITQDANGFIWFATDKGLVKYNGNQMKTFTTKNGLATNDVWGLFTTPDAKVWYLSKASKLGYIKNDSVFAFESEDKNEIFYPSNTSQIGNKIILSSSTKTHQLIHNKWKLIFKSPIAINPGKIYIENSKVAYLETNVLDSIKIVFKDGKKKEIKKIQNIINKIHSKGQVTDSLYYFSNDKEYAIINLNTAKLYRRTFKNEIGIDKSEFTRINLVNNQLQITGRGFVGILDANFHITKTTLFPEKLKAHFGFIDKNENIWFATFNNGIYKLPKVKQGIKYVLENQKIIKTNNVNHHLIANITNKGFYKYNSRNKIFTPYIIDKEYIYNSKYIKELETAYYISKNKITSVKKGKTKQFDFSKVLNEKNQTAKNIIYFNNKLYGSFSFGINQLNPQNLKIEKTYYQSGINNFLEFQKKLCIATTSGLKLFENEKITTVDFKNINFNKSILSLNKISNSLLLLNTDGFGSYITDLTSMIQLPESEFLIVNNAFVEDNTIWLATNSGILKYIKKNENYTLEKKFTIVDGLPSNNINDVTIDKNELLVSTNSGIAIVPKNQKMSPHLLDIYIEKATYNNHFITDNQSTFKYQQDNILNFTISEIDFSDDISKIKYQYKLSPSQKKWTTSITNNFNYTNLKPGEYTLYIEKKNIKKQLYFTIQPLWYQTIYFKIFIILIACLFLYLINKRNKKKYEYKVKQKAKIQQKLAEQELYALRSQMNPHFVFNSLNAIQYFITNNEIDLSEKYLVKFAQLIRLFFEFSSKKYLTLEKEIDLLKRYLEIEKMRFGEEFHYHFEIDKKLNTNTLIPTMLVQPIVENAVNHGIFHNNRKGNLVVSFLFIDANTYKVSIKDDGIGIKKAQEIKAKSIKKHNSKSTSIISERIQLLNKSKKWIVSMKTIDLTADHKTGTQVDLTFKKL